MIKFIVMAGNKNFEFKNFNDAKKSYESFRGKIGEKYGNEYEVKLMVILAETGLGGTNSGSIAVSSYDSMPILTAKSDVCLEDLVQIGREMQAIALGPSQTYIEKIVQILNQRNHS